MQVGKNLFVTVVVATPVIAIGDTTILKRRNTMRPSLGYSNLYWINKDREERRKKLLQQAPVEETVAEEHSESNTEKTKPPIQEEEVLVSAIPTHFPIVRIER